MKNVVIIIWLLIVSIAVKHFNMPFFDRNTFSYLINTSLLAFAISQIASCWCFVFFDNDMILGNVKKEILGFVNYVCDGKQGFDFKLYNELEYFLKPFFLCEKCTTGNFAFWVYILAFQHQSNIFELIFIICNSIFYTAITAKQWQK